MGMDFLRLWGDYGIKKRNSYGHLSRWAKVLTLKQ